VKFYFTPHGYNKCQITSKRRTNGQRDVSFADRVDESQRRRHGVTAAIVMDVVGARECLFVRPSVCVLDGV